MRIEINAGGLGYFMESVSMFSNPSNINSSSNHLIRSLNNVVNRTENITGGVGELEEARQSLKCRIITEENRQAATRTVLIKANEFVSTARTVDQRVANMIRSETTEFFRTNYWLRPVTRTDRIRKNLSRFFTGTIPNAVNSVVEFVKEHWKTAVLVVGIIALVAVTVLTLGKALPAILLVGAAIKAKKGIGAAILAASKAIKKTVGGRIAQFVGILDVGMWIGQMTNLWGEKSIFEFALRVSPESRTLNFVVNMANNVFGVINLSTLPGSISTFANNIRHFSSVTRLIRTNPYSVIDLPQLGFSIQIDTIKFAKDITSMTDLIRNLRIFQSSSNVNLRQPVVSGHYQFR